MIATYEDHEPTLGKGCYISPNATVMGQVTMGDESSVWYHTVVRGDVGRITIGARTNIQDVSMVHITHDDFDTHIGSDVTVGHHVMLHGCVIQDHVLVGMGAVVLDGVNVGPYCIVGAGALLTPGKQYPEGSMIMGSPGRVVRQLSDQERAQIDASAAYYVELAKKHQVGVKIIG